jgi:1-acyl-sn-glycerol-3-phosphate acyltransferase
MPLIKPVIHVEGRGHLPTHGPVIVASNHLSFIDSVVLRFAAPRRITFLTKAEYLRGRGLRGWLIRWFSHRGRIGTGHPR